MQFPYPSKLQVSPFLFGRLPFRRNRNVSVVKAVHIQILNQEPALNRCQLFFVFHRLIDIEGQEAIDRA